jgi:hypothetical protein
VFVETGRGGTQAPLFGRAVAQSLPPSAANNAGYIRSSASISAGCSHEVVAHHGHRQAAEPGRQGRRAIAACPGKASHFLQLGKGWGAWGKEGCGFHHQPRPRRAQVSCNLPAIVAHTRRPIERYSRILECGVGPPYTTCSPPIPWS